VGKIGKPHGILGEVYVDAISDDPRRFRPGARLMHESGRTLVVKSSRRHHDRLLVRFEGISDRTAAEGVRGALLVAEEQRRELADQEYWQYELVGCEVVDVSGAPIGRVTGVLAGPAHDLLAVETPRGERLVPLVEAIVVDVSVDDGRVVLQPPAGLLE